MSLTTYKSAKETLTCLTLVPQLRAWPIPDVNYSGKVGGKCPDGDAGPILDSATYLTQQDFPDTLSLRS